ncbi:hypothetical protein MY10362_001753 [Beauveria mimosiformis]
MADQLIEHLANHHGQFRILSEAEDKAATNRHNKYPEPPIIKQPNFLTNPLLRQVKRRPAQLNLSKDIPAPSSGTRSSPSKPLSAMSVREKLLQGIFMDMRRLQQSSESFDRVFPSKPAASTTKPHQQQQQRARASTEKLLNTLHHRAVELQDYETEDARRFEKQLRNVCRLQTALQLSTCGQMPFEKAPGAGVSAQRMRRQRAKAKRSTPSSLSREL